MKSQTCVVACVLFAFTQLSNSLVAADTTCVRDSEYVIQPGDVLAASIDPLLPFRGNNDATGPLPLIRPTQQDVVVEGYPLAVDPSGKVSFPLVAPVNLAGLTIEQAEKRIASIYAEQGLLKTRRAHPVFALMHSTKRSR